MPSIRVENISKRYGTLTALDGVSFEVERGELFGLIGPDGAGKTTLFRLLTTLMLPDGGSTTVDGLDVVTDYKSIRQIVGYMPGRFSLYQDLSVEENLEFFASLFGTTIAEGVETLEELEVLCALGVDYYQGYYIARPDFEPPIPPLEVAESIRQAYQKCQKTELMT